MSRAAVRIRIELAKRHERARVCLLELERRMRIALAHDPASGVYGDEVTRLVEQLTRAELTLLAESTFDELSFPARRRLYPERFPPPVVARRDV